MPVVNTVYSGVNCPCCGVQIACCPDPDRIPKILYAHVVGQGVVTLTYQGFGTPPWGGSSVYWWLGTGLALSGGTCDGHTLSVIFACFPGPPALFEINFICDADTWQTPELPASFVRCPSDGPFEVDFTGVLTDPGCPAGCNTFDITILTVS